MGRARAAWRKRKSGENGSASHPNFCQLPCAPNPAAARLPDKADKKYGLRHSVFVNQTLTKPRQTGPMKRLIPLIFLAASGAQPTPLMMGAERIEVSRNGRQYVVFKKEKTVEIIRLGYARRSEQQGIRADMIALIPDVTGCKLTESSLQGDSGEMRGRINC